MRRWLALLLLCLLPLQVSWAAVANYCGHESGPAAQHFGHHVDEHQAGSGPSDGQDSDGTARPGHDCKHHAGFIGLLADPPEISHRATVSARAGDIPSAYPVLPPERPERPRWRRLV